MQQLLMLNMLKGACGNRDRLVGRPQVTGRLTYV